ncbi:unnamed protein product [Spirodela intermedia]|uniref:E2 ubiquitin-conjugating enzyme n=1 Tax=Spirodela intermedia TaxID=51605 RepID=A0A7I8L0C9_SPIIN|nr:unnamed protein product [Spirodela intermedia]
MLSPTECEPVYKSSVVSQENNGNERNLKSTQPERILLKETYIYTQDIVKCSDYKAMLGAVMEVAGASDSEASFTDESDAESYDEYNNINGKGGDDDNGGAGEYRDGGGSLAEGRVKIMWADGSETINPISNLAVVDREFVHGDIVASISDPTRQLGRVVDVNISVDLDAFSGQTLRDISSKKLKRVRDFSAGDYVVCGPWLGRVDEVVDNVTVMFDDGSVCKVMKADPSRLKPISKRMVSDAGFPYYPGQRVKAVSSSVFKTSRWLYGLWRANHVEGTVTEVQAASVFVYWIASASSGSSDGSASAPAEEQKPKNLMLLSCFTHAYWRLGDRCLFSPPQPLPTTSGSTSKAKVTEDPIPGCNSNLNSSSSHIGDDNDLYLSDSLESSKPGCRDSGGSCRDEQSSDQPYPDEAMQSEGCESRLLNAADSPDHLVSGHSGDEFSAHSTITETSNESFSSCEDEPLICPDRTRNSGMTREANTKNEVVESGFLNHSSVTRTNQHLLSGWPGYRRNFRTTLFKSERSHKMVPSERAFSVASTLTKVDVAWQDGTREFGVNSTSLIPVQRPGDYDFFPEQYVMEKASDENDELSEVKRVGVVRSVNAEERTVCVRWLKPFPRPESSWEFDNEEVVSAYELVLHPDYDYCYGDLVVRLSSLSVSTDAPVSEDPSELEDDTSWLHESDEKRQARPGSNVTQPAKGESDKNLAWVGHITGLQQGSIEVTWADGIISKVGPQAIYVVSGEDDGESIVSESELSDDNASWETVEENEMADLDAVNEEDGSLFSTDGNAEKENVAAASSEDNNPIRHGPLSFSVSAFGFFTRLVTGLFTQGRETLDSSGTDEGNRSADQSHNIQQTSVKDTEAGGLSSPDHDISDDHAAPTNGETSETGSAVPMEADTEVKVDMLHSPASVEVDTAISFQRGYEEDGSYSFKQFDIAKDPSDHKFLDVTGQNRGSSKWIKKVQKEWNILEKNLPDAIFVRVFEDRMDLLRAVIVGACGTPYQDGLFFFDFHLLPDYPQVPPSVYYHSGGLRINPNLYEEGKVCLSILNTWAGRGNEVWDQSSSSILQVLVSIQGLVLNSRPYFNEAGYDKQVGTAEGEKNSLSYNENTYILNLRSMLYLLRRPPRHFEAFVDHHFRTRGHYILKACDAYVKGCAVGSLTNDAEETTNSDGRSSTGFKLILEKITPKLFAALCEAGAIDCQQFAHLQKI